MALSVGTRAIKRLNRDVAIRILPDAFAADAEGVARFQRSAARLTQSFKHRTDLVDCDGREEQIKAPPGSYVHPRLSPDGTNKDHLA
jgi:hypothetical protein